MLLLVVILAVTSSFKRMNTINEPWSTKDNGGSWNRVTSCGNAEFRKQVPNHTYPWRTFVFKQIDGSHINGSVQYQLINHFLHENEVNWEKYTWQFTKVAKYIDFENDKLKTDHTHSHEGTRWRARTQARTRKHTHTHTHKHWLKKEGVDKRFAKPRKCGCMKFRKHWCAGRSFTAVFPNFSLSFPLSFSLSYTETLYANIALNMQLQNTNEWYQLQSQVTRVVSTISLSLGVLSSGI
jgi:hypothetical protein